MTSEELKFTFECAFRGLGTAFKENTIQVFLLVSLLVIFLMFWLGIPVTHKVILLALIGVTLSLELLNSQVERILDHFCPEDDVNVRAIKDISAGAVLLMVTTDVVIGLVILLPKFLNKIQL
ncbi:MAG: diacylglycerol kinase [Candidatus Paceibacterota bacterium]